MNEAAICERISAWFEPKPPVVNQVEAMPRPVRSPKGAWHIGWRFVGMKRLVNFMTPLDYFHSEDASAKLLEAMPLVNVSRGGDFREWKGTNNFRHGDFTVSCINNVYVVHKDRKTAIVLGFCRFAGIEVED